MLNNLKCKNMFKKILTGMFFILVGSVYSMENKSAREQNPLLQKPESALSIPKAEPLKLEINAKNDVPNNKNANIYLNFEDATLSSVLNYLTEEKKTKEGKGINIIPHKELENIKVSLSTRNPITFDRAWNVLISLLEMNGYSLLNVDDLYRIVPNQQNAVHPLPMYSSKAGVEPEQLPDTDEVIRYIYFFNNMKPDIAQGILAPMLDQAGIQVNQDLQVVIIKEKAINIKSAMRVIKELDVGGLRESIKIIQLKETDTDVVNKLFEEILADKDKDRTIRFITPDTGKESRFFSADTKIIPYPAKNSLILLGLEKNIDKVIDFIKKYIDVPIGQADSRIHIREIKYAKAESLKPILEQIIKPPPGQASGQSIFVGKYKFFEDVLITAEESGGDQMRGGGNRLIIACNQEDWIRLEKIIEKLDKPNPQIAFEVMIVDINEQQDKQLGVQLQNRSRISGLGINDVQLNNLSSMGSLSKIDPPVEGEEGKQEKKPIEVRKLMDIARENFLGKGSPTFVSLGRTESLWGLIRSVFSANNSHIIAQPYLIANNHQPCNISIGQDTFVQGSLRTDKGETARTTKIPKRAATELSLTPQVNADGIVNLQIKVTIDEFQYISESEDPKTVRRSIDTRASMLAGEVLVLGGLKKSNLETNVYKTPIFGDIPIVGSLFKSKQKGKIESNLYIFIRPSIIKPKFEGAADEYTQLKLDYAKYQMFRVDTYVKDKDPIQRWFFRPTNGTAKGRIEDAQNFRFKPIDNVIYGKYQPKSVKIKEDPYFRGSSSVKVVHDKLRKIKTRARGS
jgi:general secretion pathway protein D